MKKRIYPGMSRTVVRDELDWVEGAMGRLATRHQQDSTGVEISIG